MQGYGAVDSFRDTKTNGARTAQWYQWLRHTREDAPSIDEQQYDVSRQAMLKQLAARADERWKSIPSFRDPPKLQQPVPAIGVNDPGGYVAPEGQLESEESMANAVASQESNDAPKSQPSDAVAKREARERRHEQSPWKAPQKGAPSENWQPDSWTPGAVQRR